MRNNLDALACLNGEQVATRVRLEDADKDDWFIVKCFLPMTQLHMNCKLMPNRGKPPSTQKMLARWRDTLASLSLQALLYVYMHQERYAAILERMPVEITQSGDRDEPWDWLMEALEVPRGTRPKKNYMVRFPNARATDLLPTLATRYREFTPNEAGSSSSAPRQRETIPDNIYLAIVRNVLTEIRANPNRVARQLSDAEIVTFARTALEASDPSSDPSQRLQWNNLIGGEIVHIVGSLIEDIIQKTEAHVADENNRRAMEVDKDYTSEDETSDDEDFDDCRGDGGGDGGGSSDIDLSD
ncbi:hypothetical protein AgCh_015719 [Apium graveolens]